MSSKTGNFGRASGSRRRKRNLVTRRPNSDQPAGQHGIRTRLWLKHGRSCNALVNSPRHDRADNSSSSSSWVPQEARAEPRPPAPGPPRALRSQSPTGSRPVRSTSTPLLQPPSTLAPTAPSSLSLSLRTNHTPNAVQGKCSELNWYIEFFWLVV